MKLKRIKDINILVVGDIMLDHYICGEVERISPEAPVPILKVTKEYSMLGGCGNVIRNIREVGAAVTCVAAVGMDVAGTAIIQKLMMLDVDSKLIKRSDIVTTKKTRFVANMGNTQMFRVDKEDVRYIKSGPLNIGHNYDVIIISDYAKGMITSDVMIQLKELNVPIIVDPKPNNMWLYDNVFMITPNKKEYEEICTSTHHPFARGIRYILKTLGKDGMELMKNKEKIYSVETIPVDVYNVTGAGDTVVSIVGLCISMGLEVAPAVKVANKCAQYVVTQPGTSVVPKKMFKNFVKEFNK